MLENITVELVDVLRKMSESVVTHACKSSASSGKFASLRPAQETLQPRRPFSL